MFIASWNTRRSYGPDGQRIAATILPDGRVAFNDVTRSIRGITKQAYPWPPAPGETPDPGEVRYFVMVEYDYNRYDDDFYIESILDPMGLAKALHDEAETMRAV